jgi:peptidoglycan/xylan/chitin deacetylase (PgdA/CDA1 family)
MRAWYLCRVTLGGALAISIDVELAWGIWDKPAPDYHARCAARELGIVDHLVATLARHRAPATWAIVARLLERDDGKASTTPHGEKIWYAPEVIERISRDPHQEIGSHSYAHVYFGETDREVLRADLAAARAVHDRHRLPFTSFVFPRNQVAHLDLLRDAGIKVFRSIDHGWYQTIRSRVGTLAGRLANLVDKALPVPPSAVHPIHHANGLVELPSSMLLFARNGLRRIVHPEVLVAKARLGLAAARRTGGIFHLWFHPSNFYHDTERQLAMFDRIVAEAARMRDAGELAIRSMGSYAA